jgi:hypothetical protein
MLRSPVLLFVALLLLAIACNGDGSPDATSTMSPRSVTPRPEVTATSRPSQGSPSSATVSPSAVPSSSPAADRPTLTATPRPDGLEFHFGAGVSDFDRSLITRAVEVTGELLSGGAEVRPSSAVFVDSSPQGLERSFAENSLAQSWRADGMAQRMSQAVAEASYRGIVINTGSVAWQEMDATERLRVVAHEYVHVIQLEQAGQEVADATLSGSVTQVPPAGPFWLLEGSAEVVSWLVLQELSLGSYAESLFGYAADAQGAGVSLESLSSFIGYRDGGRAGLGLAVLATDYLLRSRSLDSLFDFWRDIGDGYSWDSAFAREFGQPPAFLYLAFDKFYETTWEGFRP